MRTLSRDADRVVVGIAYSSRLHVPEHIAERWHKRAPRRPFQTGGDGRRAWGACHQTSSEHGLTIETGESASQLPGKNTTAPPGKVGAPKGQDIDSRGAAVAAGGNNGSFNVLSPAQVIKHGRYATFEAITTPMTLHGHSYGRYVLQHPGTEGPTEVIGELAGQASRFTATVGIDQSMNPNDAIQSGGSVEYLVYTDGRSASGRAPGPGTALPGRNHTWRDNVEAWTVETLNEAVRRPHVKEPRVRPVRGQFLER